MIRINLLADRHAKEKLIIQQQIFMGIGIIALSFVLCGAWWFMKASEIDDTNLQITNAKKELETLKRTREEVKKMEERERQVASILTAIDMLKKAKRGPTIYFDTLNVILPTEIWLTSLTETRGAMTIGGYSFSNNAIAKLMKSMEESRQFSSVELREITQAKVGGETIKKFNLQALTAIGKQLAEEEKKKKEEIEKAKSEKAKPAK